MRSDLEFDGEDRFDDGSGLHVTRHLDFDVKGIAVASEGDPIVAVLMPAVQTARVPAR